VCQGRLTSDQNGNLYAVTDSGELLHNRHANGDPKRRLLYPGTGRVIGRGFKDIRTLIAWSKHQGESSDSSESHMAFFTSNGNIYYNRVQRVDTDAPRLALPVPGTAVTESWTAAIVGRVFCDENGKVYWLTAAGELYEGQTVISSDRAPSRPGDRKPPLASGWTDLLYIFSAGTDRFFSIDLWGELRYHEKKLVGRSRATRGYQKDGKECSGCWNTPSAVLGAGGGGIYSITTEGDLRYTCLRIDGERLSLIPPAYGVRVGQAVDQVCCELPPLVEGYCWPLSAEPGDPIDFKVSVTERAPQGSPVKCGVRYLRLRRISHRDESGDGRYIDVSDHETMPLEDHFTAEYQHHGSEDWKTGCNWDTSFRLAIPRDEKWRSGLYAAECRPVEAHATKDAECVLVDDPNREQEAWYVVFIVRPTTGDRSAELAVLANTNTWNAYNCWGGKSKYHCYGCSPLPQQLSFERPNPGSCPSKLQTRCCCHVRGMTACGARAELWVLTWLEDNGYSFHLYSDQDLDCGIEGISKGDWRYKALILNTHPEYWTTTMYDNLERYLSRGGSLVYLGGNAIYEDVEYVKSGRAMLVLQRASVAALNSCEVECARENDLWRNLGRPERAILGVGFSGYVDWPIAKTPYEVEDATHQLLHGVDGKTIGATGLHGAACQWEMDYRCVGTPSGVTLLASGQNWPGDFHPGAEMVYRKIGEKNFVFSAGSLGFGSSLIVDKNLQTVVKNVLKEAGIVPSSGAPFLTGAARPNG